MLSRARLAASAIVLSLVLGFEAVRVSTAGAQQEGANRLPPIFAVGRTVQHGGAKEMRIAEVRGNWIRVESPETRTDAWYYVLTDGAWMAK